MKLRHLALALVAAALVLPAAATTKAGANEGELSVLAWDGYLEDAWVKPFEQQSGCDVKRKYARSAAQLVTLMRSGARDRYDVVSAPGEAASPLISTGTVKALDSVLPRGWAQFAPAFRGPASTTVRGKHYGVAYQWGVNSLLYDSRKVRPAPQSWSVLYGPRYGGKITLPDNPLHIADAALYLAKTQPRLGIDDPYALTRRQLAAAVALLKRQKPLVRSYWDYPSDEIDLFEGGKAVIGVGWTYTVRKLLEQGVPVEEVIPKEGATGWLDSWLLNAKARHPSCAAAWLGYVSTPKVQALQAVSFGSSPVNRLACAEMEKLVRGSCAGQRANEPNALHSLIAFARLPVKDCGNGRKECTDYEQWIEAWRDAIS